MRLCNLVGAPLRGAPVKGLARVDDVIEGADSLLHGRLAIGAVGIDEVDVLEIEALQGGVDTLDDVLAGETVVVDFVVAKGVTPEDLRESTKCQSFCTMLLFFLLSSSDVSISHLGGDDEVVSLPAILFDGLAHDNLALAAGIHFGAVEKVDARVVRGLHAGIGALFTTNKRVSI